MLSFSKDVWGPMKTFLARYMPLAVGCQVLLAACSMSSDPVPEQAILSPSVATEPVEPIVVEPPIINSSFEQEWTAWKELPDGGENTAISDEPRTGEHSAKITSEEGRFEQIVIVEPQTDYEVSAFIRGSGQIGVDLPAETMTAETTGSGELWLGARLSFNTGNTTQIVIFGAHKSGVARFDDFSITPVGETSNPLLGLAE